MCVSCGCWSDMSQKMGGDGNHPEDSSVMPNIKIEKAPENGSSPKSSKV